MSHPIQYQAPLFRALASDGRVDLHVLFLSRHGLDARTDPGFGVDFQWDVDLLSGYSSSFLGNLRERAAPGTALSYVNPGIGRALSRAEPDAVLFFGARNPTSLAALAWARRADVTRLYRAESSVLQHRNRRTRAFARAVLRQMDALLPIGTANDLYYDALGVPEARRYFAPYAVDNAFFRERRIERGEARQRLGLADDEVVLLYAGKLVSQKAPDTLVEACARLPGEVRLLVAGDGPLRGQVEALAAARGVALTSLGFLNQSELPVAYSAADVLVLPSLDEPWGLVVNEAMASGLPVVVSSRVGARLDLVIDGETGAVFRAGDALGLARALDPLASSPELRRQVSAAALRRIERWDIRHTTEGIVRAVEANV